MVIYKHNIYVYNNYQKFYYFYDSLGSVSVITGENGLPLQNYTYSPYGSTMNADYDPVNNLHFIGRYGGYKDDDTGQTYFWHRWYDEGDGRWVSRDQVKMEFDINLMAYVSNSPTYYIDPNGLCPGGEVWQPLSPPISPESPTKTDTRTQNKFDVCLKKPYPAPSPTPCTLKSGILTEVIIRCVGRGGFIPICVVFCKWTNGITGYITFFEPTVGIATQDCIDMGPPCR